MFPFKNNLSGFRLFRQPRGAWVTPCSLIITGGYGYPDDWAIAKDRAK